MNIARAASAIAFCLTAAMATLCPAERLMRILPGGAAGPGTVNLPYVWNDNTGNQWQFYQQGQFQHSGNMPVYSQGAMLMINGAYPQGRANQARMDDKTGELVFENLACGQVAITRRVLFNRDEGWVRYVDILRNTGGADLTLNISYQANTNYGVQMAVNVSDPRKADQNIAWVAQTHANGRCAVEMFAGKGARTAPLINYQPGNSAVQVNFSPTLPARKEIALMHFHTVTPTIDAGQKFVQNLKESRIMASIAPAIRRLIVNFRGGENFIGDYEILRGEILDVVELRSGDQLRGTLKEKTFRLRTFYGDIELSAEKMIGMINAGDYRPRQLLITADGEVFGGALERERVTLELSSGQAMEIPLAQIGRMGYRRRQGEPEEWSFEKPFVLMRAGDRIGVRLPEKDIEVATRYGLMKLRPDIIRAITFQNEEHGVHDIALIDGSRFAGLVTAEVFEMKLGGDGREQIVKFPASSIRRIQLFSGEELEEPDRGELDLLNDDLLIGTLTGTLKLDTAFSTINISAGEIKRLVHNPTSPTDVQVTLWDDTVVSGQLQEQHLVCRLKSGIEMKVPVALVEQYVQPRPQPSPAVMQTIKALVAGLDAEDWKARDAAQEQLIAMGTIVIAPLKQMKPSQSPEAQQRIDIILKRVESAPAGGKSRPAGASAVPVPPPAAIEN